jgi:hypothetical protein
MSSQTPSQILAVLGPSCRDNARRQRLLAQTTVNGIDFVEFETIGSTQILHVHFLLPLPVGAWNLPVDPSPIGIHGGARIVGVKVVSVAVASPSVLDIEVDEQGDFSPYLLSIGWRRDELGAWTYLFAGLDRLFSVAPINFRPGCPVDFDCAPDDDCPPGALVEPALDYLARDYASFRQLLIDLAAQRNPTWTERSPADLGITLLELFATEGDHLAYLQDAVANESYLDTARRRESAKRHARLVDYRMHDGRNAWTWVHLGVIGNARTIPTRTQVLTRIDVPLRFLRGPAPNTYTQPAAPPSQVMFAPSGIDASGQWFDDYVTDPALAQIRVFETVSEGRVDRRNNELSVHTWGNKRCCLPIGTTSAHVFAIDATGTHAIRPPLEVGDLLLLEEVRGPDTGAEADADPTHRQVVRITRVVPDPSLSTTGSASDQMHDPLYLAALTGGELAPVTVPVPVNDTLPLVEVTWRAEDALSFPLCLSAAFDDGTAIERISVARGNLIVADHGRSITEDHGFDPPFGGDRARIRLDRSPLTMTRPTPGEDGDVRETVPVIGLDVTRVGGGPPTPWQVAPDLLVFRGTDPRFVADVDAAGRPTLRFGDGDYGQRLSDVTSITATYRIGNGRPGNIGADGLAHIVRPDTLPPTWPLEVLTVRNPLPARGGIDAETIEEVRQYAPAAFRAIQYRAVTEDDYRRAALTAAGVAGAVASFRWTGSWYTVFVGIDPADPDQVLTDARGHTRLAPAFRQRVTDVLDRYRLAGYDLEVRSARYVPLDITIDLCVKPGFFRGDVAEAVAEGLSGRARRRSTRGLFDPANLTFAQPVYLSTVYAAVEAVEGVDSADVRIFRRHGASDDGELARGFIPIGPWEIAQLDNDPNRMENGTLTLNAAGGS